MKESDLVRLFNVSPSGLEGYRKVYTMRPYLTPRIYENSCRYKNIRRLEDEDTGKVYHENWIKRIIDISEEDTYITVDMTRENRLDMISYEYYNTPRFWWVIAIANDILDPFDVPIGTQLRIPTLSSLYNEGGILSGN